MITFFSALNFCSVGERNHLLKCCVHFYLSILNVTWLYYLLKLKFIYVYALLFQSNSGGKFILGVSLDDYF